MYVPADDGLGSSWSACAAAASLHEVMIADGADRRHFLALAGTSLTAFAHDWMFDPARIAVAVRGRRVGHAVVDDLERIAEARRRLDDAFGGGTLLQSIREDLRLITNLLGNAGYTEEVGKRLYGVAAELARIAGLQADECDQQALAQRF